MNLKNLLLLSINASINAGKEIMNIYSTDFIVDNKKDDSPLTLADKKSNNIIELALKKTRIPYLSEEGKSITYEERKDWEYLWIIDPLDGTKEFVKRNGEFTVNIALIKNNKPIMGVIYVPCTNDLYFGLQELGAFKVNIDYSIQDFNDLIQISQKLPLLSNRKKHIIVGSRSHMSKETEEYFKLKLKQYKTVEVLAIGSSLKICLVAEGKADSYPRYAPTMEWDTAAGHAIANMAGYKILEYNTIVEMTYNKQDLLNPWFLVEKASHDI
jgi:3'(2'), 5'-bisphosphate nucleotidase